MLGYADMCQVKLHGGEYVPLEHMECKYGNSLYVDALAGGIMIYADGTMDRSVAFVQANKKEVTAWAEAKGIKTEWPALLQDIKVRAFVWDDMLKVGKAGGLGDLETLFNVTLLDGVNGDGPDAWTPANGSLTATNKLQRKVLPARKLPLLPLLSLLPTPLRRGQWALRPYVRPGKK
jgi:long-chain acyl-CoA synthetase